MHYFHSIRRDLHVRRGCVCLDERVAISHLIKNALIKDHYSRHPGSLEMVFTAHHGSWPYMNFELPVRSIECKTLTTIVKNLKSIMPTNWSQPHTPCIVPNQKLPTDFAGPFNIEKEHENCLLTCFDRFSKYPSAENFDNANASNLLKFLDN